MSTATRKSTRPTKPVDRYVPAETKMTDDCDGEGDDAETASSSSSSPSADEQPTQEDLDFVVPDKAPIACEPGGSSDEEEEAESTDDEDWLPDDEEDDDEDADSEMEEKAAPK